MKLLQSRRYVFVKEHAFCFISATLLSTILGSSAQQSTERREHTVIHNDKIMRAEENEQDFFIELARTFGGAEIEDENLAFNLPNDIVVNPLGDIYILDRGNRRIQ
jgi:hypothetical protein